MIRVMLMGFLIWFFVGCSDTRYVTMYEQCQPTDVPLKFKARGGSYAIQVQDPVQTWAWIIMPDFAPHLINRSFSEDIRKDVNYREFKIIDTDASEKPFFLTGRAIKSVGVRSWPGLGDYATFYEATVHDGQGKEMEVWISGYELYGEKNFDFDPAYEENRKELFFIEKYKDRLCQDGAVIVGSDSWSETWGPSDEPVVWPDRSALGNP